MYEKPVATRRAEIVVEWTQELADEVNVANYILTQGRFNSLDGSIRSVGQIMSIGQSGGWTFNDEKSSLRVTGSRERQSRLGFGNYQARSNKYTTGDIRFTDVNGNDQVYRKTIMEIDKVVATPVDVTPYFREFTYKLEDVWFSFEYAQDYKETLFARMDVPLSDGLAREEEAEPMRLSLNNIFEAQIGEYPEWIGGLPYEKGAIVMHNGVDLPYSSENRLSLATTDDALLPGLMRVKGDGPPSISLSNAFASRLCADLAVALRASCTARPT